MTSLQQKLEGFQQEDSVIEITGLSANKTKFAKIHSIHNRIHIDKGLYLAKKPHQINREWGCSAQSDFDLVAHYLPLFREWSGLLRFSEKTYRPIFDCLFANLLNAANTDSQLLYSRRTGDKDARIFISVIDYLEAHGLIYNVIGRNNEYSGNSSWMFPTGKLQRHFQQERVKVALVKGAAMIVLRDEDGNDKPIKTGMKAVKLEVDRLSKPVQDYNRLWLDHSATLHGNDLVPFMRRIFNKALNLGGRYYGASHLTLPKGLRGLIEINGESTTEPDFKALHLCLLYASRGLQIDPVKSDPYTIPGYHRGTIKLALLTLVNAGDLSRWCANVTKSGNPDTKRAISEYEREYVRFIMRSSLSKSAKQPHKPLQAKGFVKGMPDGIQGKELLAAIENRHSCISDLFGSPDLGLKLQFLDSQIMSYALVKLVGKGVPVLPVHDSIRCRISDEKQVREVMLEAYKVVTGFEGFLG